MCYKVYCGLPAGAARPQKCLSWLLAKACRGLHGRRADIGQGFRGFCFCNSCRCPPQGSQQGSKRGVTGLRNMCLYFKGKSRQAAKAIATGLGKTPFLFGLIVVAVVILFATTAATLHVLGGRLYFFGACPGPPVPSKRTLLSGRLLCDMSCLGSCLDLANTPIPGPFLP